MSMFRWRLVAAGAVLCALTLARPGAPHTRALQEPAPASGVEVVLHDNMVTWHTAPGTVVRAELRSGTTVKSQSPQRLAGEDGVVVLPLGVGGGGPGGGGGGGGGNQANAQIRPGDRVVLLPDGGDPVAFDVPDLHVALDAAGDRLVGRAPAGASLEVAVDADAAPFAGTATANASGDVALAVPGVVAGDTGSAVLRLPSANVVTALAGAVRAELAFGSSQTSGVATPGGTITIGYHHLAGGNAGQNTTNVNGGTDWNLNTGMGGGGGPGGGGPGANRVPFSVGDTVTVTYASGLPGAAFSSMAVLPTITINDGGDGFVGGEASPGARVEVQAVSPDGTAFSAITTADGAGRWAADLSAATGLGPGWRLRAAAEAAPGIFVVAVDAIEQIRVGVHRDLVMGVADPGTPISVTLRAPDGTEKDADATGANNQGTFNASVGPMEVGDLLEVYFVQGDPIVMTIPELSAVADPVAEAVSGVGPVGATVVVGQGGGQNAVERSATVGDDGRWTVSLAGARDVEPPMSGSVTVRMAGGHELFTSWAAVRLTTEVGDAFVSGNGPAGRDVVAELVDPSGTVVATGVDAVPAGGGGPGGGGPGGGGAGGGNGGEWLIDFEDDTGAEVRVRAGDTIRATVGDERIALLVPTLRGVAFVADDAINGQTTSGSDVIVRVTRPLVANATTVVTATVDAAGTFAHVFPDEGDGAYDLQHNDAILLQTRVGRHNVNSQLFVPGLRLELDQAVLVGSWTPEIEVDVAVVGAAGGTKATARTTAGEDAVFNAVLVDASGERIEPQPGDKVLVLPFGDLSAEPLELVVPELTLAANVVSNTIGGRATPGGILQVNVRDAIDVNPQPGFGPQAGAQPTIGADGSWSAGPFGGGGPGGGGPGGGGGGYDVRAGTRMQAQYRLPSGHLVGRTRYVPMISVQHGGSSVCGFSDPRSTVAASLRSAAGAAVGDARGTAGYNSFFALGLAKDGEPAIAEAGQRVEAQLGSTSIALELPSISISVDWAADRVTGTGPASTMGQLFQPARSCLDTQPRQSQPFGVNASGAFTITNIQGPPRDPGEGIEVAFITAEGHRIYRHAFRSLAQIFVGTDRVAGRATEGTPAIVTVNGPGGAARGTATTKAGANGFFDVRVPASGGGALTIGEGDVVRLEASGETVDVAVEPLAFDWSPNDPIVGTALPGRALTLSMRLRDGRIIDVERTADAAGRLRYAAQDVPPRADWSLADIVGVRLIALTPNGHQLISEAGDFGDVPVAPPDGRDGQTIFLPYAANRR